MRDPTGVSSVQLYGQTLTEQSWAELAGCEGQLFGVDLVELDDGPGRGTRVARVRTGRLDFDVIIDRALDIGRAAIDGVPVAWVSPTGIVSPALVERREWAPLRTFFGGLLTTCGLEHVFGPVDGDASHFGYHHRPTDQFPLHGRLTGTPAEGVSVGTDWRRERPVVFVGGRVRQVSLFGEHFVLERRIEAEVAGASVTVTDTVTNAGHAPTPLLILYHVNLGWPLLSDRSVVTASVSRSKQLTLGTEPETWTGKVPGPVSRASECVWEHTPVIDAAGSAVVSVVNPDIGDGRRLAAHLRFAPDALPRLLEWQVAQRCHYALGLEPTNADPRGREAQMAEGALPFIGIGESRSFGLELRLVLGGTEEPG